MIIALRKHGSTLVSRDLAKGVFSTIAYKDEPIDLDFSGVETATPSFLHEMLVVIRANRSSNRGVSFKNANESVQLQLRKALSSLDDESVKNIETR